MIVDVIIEIPKYCKHKYKYQNGKFIKKRNLAGRIPENYGFVENTIAPDNAPLDIVVIGNKPRKQGHMKAKVIGALTRYDRDEKILAVNCRSKINSIRKLSNKKLGPIINTFSGTWPGMTPMKKLVGPREAEKIVRKYSINKSLN